MKSATQITWTRARENGTIPRIFDVSRPEAAVIRAKWEARKRASPESPKNLLERWILRRGKRARMMAKTLLAAMPTPPYSMGSAVEVRVIGPARPSLRLAVRDTRREYAKSCRFSAVHGYLAIELSPADLMRSRVISDVITVARRWPGRRKGAAVPCYYFGFERGKGNTINVIRQRGYLCGGSHAPTRAEAVRLDRECRMASARKWIAARASESARKTKEAENRAKLAIYGNDPVSRADSYAAGNCRVGTEAWLFQAGLAGEACTLAELAEAVSRVPSERAENVLARVLSKKSLLPARMADVSAIDF